MSERSTWFSGAIAFALLIFITLRFAPERIQTDIDARATAVTARSDGGWARVINEARDLTLYGRAPDELAVSSLRAELGALRGVRTVHDRTQIDALRLAAAAKTSPHYTPRERAASARLVSPGTCQRIMDGLLSSRGVVFVPQSAVLHPASIPLLEHLTTAAVYCPDARLTVAGHTDDTGDGKRSRRLSAARAEAVAAYLIRRGVRHDRLGIIGYGADRPVADGATARGRALNRRIEITVEY